MQTIGNGGVPVRQETARKRFILWIDRSRLNRFLFYFPVFTLTCYLVQYFVDRIWGPFHHSSAWTFPLVYGVGMGISLALTQRKSFPNRPK